LILNSSSINPEHEGDPLNVPTGAVAAMLLHITLSQTDIFLFLVACETVGLFNYALWVFLLCLLYCFDVTALTIYSPANQY
jgi:hypothetical protein